MSKRAGGHSSKTDAPHSLQCCVVVDPSPHNPSLINPRVEVIKEFIPEIPKRCEEASLGNTTGSFVCSRELPGIPGKKFGGSDKERAVENKDKEWQIQAVYQDDSGDPEKLVIYYEGWNSLYLEPTTRTIVKKNTPSFLRSLNLRQKFVQSQKNAADKAHKEGSHRNLFVEPNAFCDPNSSFWLFEDLTYFHSILNSELNLAPVLYMALYKPVFGGRSIKPPIYAYTARNIVPIDVYNFCMRQMFNKSFDELMQGRRLFPFPNPAPKNVCPGDCVCDKMFPILYRKEDACTKKMSFTSDGRLDLSNFVPTEARVLIECSDRCRCDASCPRRALQRGQQKPLVVNYKPGFGYGVFTAAHIFAGELVCEYTGKITFVESASAEPQKKKTKLSPENDQEEEEQFAEEEDHSEPGDSSPSSNPSYDAGFTVMAKEISISSWDTGNIGRFINHGCSPNARFVEVHSRRSEDDPLIPRIAVFAVQDICFGEEVFVSYWTENELRLARKSSIRCLCGADNCIQFLPEALKRSQA